MKLTVHPHDVCIGDRVMGFASSVAHTAIDGWLVTITFADGTAWTTSDIFLITVIREE